MGIYRLASICGDGGLVEDLSSLAENRVKIRKSKNR